MPPRDSARPRLLAAAGLALGLALGALTYAVAAPSPKAAPKPVKACVTKKNVVVSARPSGACPRRTTKKTVAARGPRGVRGVRGPAGPAGPGSPTTRVDRLVPFETTETFVNVAPGITMRCRDLADPVQFLRTAEATHVMGTYTSDRSGGNADVVGDWDDLVVSIGTAEETAIDLYVRTGDASTGPVHHVQVAALSSGVTGGCRLVGTTTLL